MNYRSFFFSNFPKATRQLNQLGNIKHELAQISREAEIFLESSSNSKKFKDLQSEAGKTEELRIELQQEVESKIQKWDEQQDLLKEIDAWLRQKEEILDLTLTEPEMGSFFNEAVERLQSKLKNLEEIINQEEIYSEKLSEIQDHPDSRVVSERLENLKLRASRDLEDTKRSLCVTQKVTEELKNLTSKIDQLQGLFHDTVQNFNQIGNSSVRLSQFESILKALEAEKEPAEEIKEKLQRIRSQV